MSDNSFFISPAGYVAEYNYETPPFRGQTQAPYTVTQIVPGQVISARTSGPYSLHFPMNAVQGLMRVRFTPGTLGLARALAFLVDSVATPTKFLGIAIDADNRPLVFIQNRDGAFVVKFTDLGPSYPAGTQVTFTLAWKAVDGSASIAINGVGTSTTWTLYPSGAWSAFTPTALLVGSVYSNFQNLTDFNGTIGRVEVLTVPGVYPSAIPVSDYNHFSEDPLVTGDLVTMTGGTRLVGPNDGLYVSDAAEIGWVRQAIPGLDSYIVTDAVETALS